ncbi:hypothetical protein GF402_03170 [Candidatus Fermentibacteria bacterium]|nr:hypothetical protein [Candidatus Fermentibacteria bacterium]
MALEEIAERIARDAREAAERIVSEAEAEKAARISEAKERLEKEFERDSGRLRDRIEELRLRQREHLRREADRKVQTARSTMINRAIDRAVQNLVKLGDEEYLQLISAILARCALRGEVEVLVCPEDEGRITKDFLSRHSDQDRRFVLSEQRHRSVGGVVLRAGDVSQNATFSMIADLAHEELVMELAAELPLER